MLPDQFKTTSQNLSGGKALAFINIFGLFVGLAFFGLVARCAIDDFQPDATSIFGQYEWYKAITGQPEDAKANISASANYTPTPAISVSNSTASSMVCTPSILNRKVFLTSFKLVRRVLACKNERTCLNWSVSK
jgi:hypothetical protein